MLISIGLILLGLMIHEAGHALVAYIFKVPIKWKLVGFRIVFVFLETSSAIKYNLVKVAGFWFELLFGLFVAIYLNNFIPLTFTIFRFGAYPIYAGRYNDFVHR